MIDLVILCRHVTHAAGFSELADTHFARKCEVGYQTLCSREIEYTELWNQKQFHIDDVTCPLCRAQFLKQFGNEGVATDPLLSREIRQESGVTTVDRSVLAIFDLDDDTVLSPLSSQNGIQVKRSYELTLEVRESEVVCYWNYIPRSHSIAGRAQVIGIGGSFGGLSYDRLCEIGTGTHFNTGFDERSSTHGGTTESDAVRSRRVYQAHAFREQMIGGDGFSFDLLLRIITPENTAELEPYIIPVDRERLKEFATHIPATVADRAELQKEFLLGTLGSGGFWPYSDATLETIKRVFGDSRTEE